MIDKSVVTARNVLLNPTRTGFLTVMERMGADVTIDSDKTQQLGGETGGDITVRYRGRLEATRIKAEEIATLIDEVPILALLAATAQGETVFEQVSELRVKESDRLAAIINGLSALGFRAWEQGDDLHVMGGTPTMSAQAFATHGDHRLAMTWSVAARAFGLNLNISDPECAAVSYPGFFDDLRRLS
jgi:3-phosphoshikimate 1-carboxyvinyltransferase